MALERQYKELSLTRKFSQYFALGIRDLLVRNVQFGFRSLEGDAFKQTGRKCSCLLQGQCIRINQPKP